MRISIIIPAHNASRYIRRCLESLIGQTYKSWDCIIIDDCSADDTATKAEDITMGDERFAVIRLEKNVGIAMARNCGIRYAQGNALFFLDADDWILPKMLEEVVSIAEGNPDVGRIFTPPMNIWFDGSESKWDVTPPGIHLHDSPYLFANTACDPGHSTGCLYMLDNIPCRLYFPSVPIYEDLLFNMGLIFAGITTYISRDSLYMYYRHMDSAAYGDISVDTAKEIICILDELAVQFNPDKDVYLRCKRFVWNLLISKLGNKSSLL